MTAAENRPAGSESGVLRAVLDGRYITEARTAAVSAVSVRHLARNPGPVTVALLGSGVQAGAHLEALQHVCGLGSVRVWSPNSMHRVISRTCGKPSSGCP